MAKTKKTKRAAKSAAAPSAALKTVEGLRKKFGIGSALVMREGGFAKVDTVMPTGMDVVDKYLFGIGGLPCGRIVEVAGVEASGKAQPVESPVLTPGGFVPIGSVRPGDEIISDDGKAYGVLGVFPQGVKEVFQVAFSDGTSTECCGEHLWMTQTERERATGSTGSVKSLTDIAASLSRMAGRWEFFLHSVPEPAPVEFAEPVDSLSLDPYLLGALLGDGGLSAKSSISFHKPEVDVAAKVASRLPPEDEAVVIDRHGGLRFKRRVRRKNMVSETKKLLGEMGLLGTYAETKHVPPPYLFASVEQRRDLLRGLFDTDGSVAGGRVDYSTSSPQLAIDVAFLARSLGGRVTSRTRATAYTYQGEKHVGRMSYRLRVFFPDGFVPVSSAKHLARWRATASPSYKSIVGVTSLGGKECVCIAVDAPSRLYLTDDFVVTHNTTLLNVWMGAAQRDGMKVFFADAENRYDPSWGEKVGGINTGELIQLQPDHLEQFHEQVEYLQAHERKPIFIGLDSVAAIPTERELGEGKDIPAEHAAIWAKYMRKFSQRTARRGDIVVLINQPRNKVGVLYGNPETTFGGRAIKHFAGVRLTVFHGKSVKRGDFHVARYMHLGAEKVAFVPPHRKVTLKLVYDTGFDDRWATLEHAKAVGCATTGSENVEAAYEALGWPVKPALGGEAPPEEALAIEAAE